MGNQNQGGGGGKTILIGCVVIILLVLCLMGGLCGWIGYKTVNWQEKIQEKAAETKELRKKVNEANPFEIPEDGLVPEERLVTYLDVREKIGEVWPEAEEAISRWQRVQKGEESVGLDPSIMDIPFETTMAYFDLQEKHLKLLQEYGMNFDEWRFITYMVYSKWYKLKNPDYETAAIDLPHDLPEQNKELFSQSAERIGKLAHPGLDKALLATQQEAVQSAMEAETKTDTEE